MAAYKPYLRLKSRAHIKIREDLPLDGEFFFSDDVADSPCDAAFYIVPHKTEPMFKVGWGVAADRRLDTINEIWGNQLDIYSALVVSTSREAALYAESTMKRLLRRQGRHIKGLPPLEGQSEFFSTDCLLYAHDACISKLLPTMRDLEDRTHLITARGADESTERMFERIAKKRAGKLVSVDRTLLSMHCKLRPVDVSKVINAIAWDDFPQSIIMMLRDAIRSKYSIYAPFANDLWIKFGEELLKQPINFLQIADPYQVTEGNLLSVLNFIKSHNVIIRDQSNEWIAEILGALSARAMMEFVESNEIDLRCVTFEQRSKIFKKTFREKNNVDLMSKISQWVDDIDQLKIEAAECWNLESRFGEIRGLQMNLNHVNFDVVPKNFPGMLAKVYFDFFDGVVDGSIIRPPHWPAHEQMHLNSLRVTLRELKCKTADGNNRTRDAMEIAFIEALLVAMLDLYPACFKENNGCLLEEIACSEYSNLAEYFDCDRSSIFYSVRKELRQSYGVLMSIKKGILVAKEDLKHLKLNIGELQMSLADSEEGRYYSMYFFQQIVADFGGWVITPSSQSEEEGRLLVVKFLKDLWSLVHLDIKHHHHTFNALLINLHKWAAEFELQDVPAAHPQALL